MWRFRQPITIGSRASALTNFPVYLDMSGLSDHFFSNVQSTGADIRIYKSDNTTQVPFELVTINTTSQTGELWFKGDLNTAATTFYIWYGDATASAYAPTDPYGSQAVWTGALGIFHGTANINDSSNGGRNGTFGEVTQGTGYLDFPGEVSLTSSVTGTTALAFGKVTTFQRIGQSFVAGSSTVAQVDLLIRRMASGGVPANNVTFGIQADSAGSPSGVNISSQTINTATFNDATVNTDLIAFTVAANLTLGTTYWIVMSASSTSDTNFWNLAYNPSGTSGVLKTFDGAAWNVQSGSLRFTVYKSGYVDLGSALSMTYNDFSIAFRLNKSAASWDRIMSQLINNGSGYVQFSAATDVALQFESTTNNVFNPTLSLGGLNVVDNNYHQFVLISTVTSFTLLVDGISRASTTANTDTAAQQFRYFGAIGGRLNGKYGQALSGQMQQIFFRPSISVSQAAAEYANQSSPTTFYTIGLPQTINGWTLALKPTDTAYTQVNPLGKQVYDQFNVTYDDSTTFYDGVNQAAWTSVPKPVTSLITIVTGGNATGLLMPLTRSTISNVVTEIWTMVNKPT